MELEINVICTELDSLLADFLTSWAEDLGKERDAAELERLYCMYPRVISQIASARASLWGADQMMAVARNLRFAPAPEVELRAMHVSGGCGHPCSSGVSGVYVARSGDHGCRCHEHAEPRGTERTTDRDVIRPSDRDYEREVSSTTARASGRDAGREDDRNSEESSDDRNADRFRA
ncbi:hypothetical protein [Pannonibacter carbonis]|uniref:hypothetical protein n=1 Tax=Pannonibacter carbonis TaxID=2067569 RepID=UPI000D1123F7|nr:hypothetical protein [Pannonibacter carbonis]